MLRYVGNKTTPEPVLYDPVERMVTALIPPETIALALGDLQKFAESVSNPLFSDMAKNEESGLFLPTQPKQCTWSALNRSAFTGWTRNEVEPKPDPPEEPFEVNLTTPLVGYRAWNIQVGLLVSLNEPQEWTPDKPMKAHCLVHNKNCKPCPSEHCTCGIYAVDEIKDNQWGAVWGKVYGWGRYVRGENGWRAQYAYPAEFLLATDHDRETYGILRKYHVPISQFMPIQVYHPSEDGYENWQDQEDRNLGTSRESDAQED